MTRYTTRDVNKYYRDLVTHNSAAGALIDMWVELAFEGKRLVFHHPQGEREAARFAEALPGMIGSDLYILLTEYLVFGRFVAHAILDVTTYNYEDLIVEDLDYCHITISPLNTFEPKVELCCSEEQQKWASSLDPRVAEQRKNIDPKIVELLRAGKPITLKNPLFLPRMAHAHDYFGTSYLAGVKPDMSPDETFTAVGLMLPYCVTNERLFQEQFLNYAAELRSRITNYILREQLLPRIAEAAGYSEIPSYAWLEDSVMPRDPKAIVVQALKAAGINCFGYAGENRESVEQSC